MEQLNYKDIWETLSQVDVSKHTETKGEGNFKLTYLSWAWAWGVLMEHYPESQYSFEEYEVNGIKLPYCPFPDGSGEVVCKVYIGGVARKMWLPVMDYKNAAIKNPNARAISDAKMRCLVKCMALFGLGHYIYAGEDLPSTPSKDDTEKKSEKKVEEKNTISTWKFRWQWEREMGEGEVRQGKDGEQGERRKKEKRGRRKGKKSEREDRKRGRRGKKGEKKRGRMKKVE